MSTRERPMPPSAKRPPKAPVDMSGTVAELLAMSSKDFFQVVDRDIRDALPNHQHEALRSDPQLVERWYQTLAAMKRSVEGTLAAKNSESKADRIAYLQRNDPDGALDVSQRHHKWRAGALRFATGVAEKLSEARYHRLRFYPLVLESAAVIERNQISERYENLLSAIRKHREEIESDEDADPSEADLTLWEYLPQ